MAANSLPKKQKCLSWVKADAQPFKFTDSAPVVQPTDLSEKEVLIQNYVAGLNPVDWKMAENNWGQIKLPSVTGYDISGKVVSVGNSVKQFKVGDEVFGMLSLKTGGGFQQYSVADEGNIVKKPSGVSHEQAGSLGVAFLSALDGLQHVKHKINGATVFIPGGSGGVGHFIVQICKIWGAKTIITSASKDDGIKLLKETYKCDHVLNHAKSNVVDEVKKLTNNLGADIVYDATYLPSSFEKSIQCTAENGGSWIVLGDFANKGSVEAEAVEKRHAELIHADVAKYTFKPEYQAKAKDFVQQGLKQAAEWIVSGQLKPHISEVVQLEQVEQALEKLKKGQTGFGKVVAKIH